MEKNVGGTYTEYTYDASGEPIGENNRTSWTAEFFDFQGRHLVHYQNSATYFVHPNTVGSTGQVTDYSGAMAQDELHYPWGQEWAMVGTLQEERFARLRHRDSEANLDPTHFRMFSSDQGRWLSPDPACGSVTNPQTLDRYAYVGNSPTSRTDPRGDQYCDPFYDPYCGYYGGYCDPYFGCGYGFGFNFALPSIIITTLTCTCVGSGPLPLNSQGGINFLGSCLLGCSCTDQYGNPSYGFSNVSLGKLIPACGAITSCDLVADVQTKSVEITNIPFIGTLSFGLAQTVSNCIPY